MGLRLLQYPAEPIERQRTRFNASFLVVLLEIAISRPYLESAERTGEDRGNQEAGSSAGEDPSRRDKTNLFLIVIFPSPARTFTQRGFAGRYE